MTTYNISYNGENFVNDNGVWYEVSEDDTWYEIEDSEFEAELDAILTSSPSNTVVPDDTGRRCSCEDYPCCGCYS